MDSRQRSIAVTSSKAVKNLMVARPKHFTGGESSHNQRSRENAVGEEGTEGLSAGGGLFPMLRDEEGSSNEEEHERPNNRPRRNVSVPNSPSKNSRRDMVSNFLSTLLVNIISYIILLDQKLVIKWKTKLY